jgi:hypothetical protein
VTGYDEEELTDVPWKTARRLDEKEAYLDEKALAGIHAATP